MSFPLITDRDDLRAIWDAHLAGESERAIAERYGISRSSMQRTIARIKRWGGPDAVPEPPPDWGKQGKTTIQAAIDEQGNATVERVWMRMHKDAEALEALAQSLSKSIKPCRPIKCSVKRADDDLMGLYPIGDHHLGMYSWAAETGEDWNADQSVSVLQRAVEHHISKMPKVGHYVLASLGDFMHADFRTPATEKSGHHLDADTRWRRCLDMTVEVMIYAIDRFASKVPRLTVIMTPGNHDYHSANAAALILAAYYRKSPHIEVRTDPKEHHAVEFGEVLNVFTHGDKMPATRVPGWAASEYREAWGRTRWTYVHQGHIHKARSGQLVSSSDESDRVHIEYHPILAARDAYAAAGGWSSQRLAQQIIQHRKYGEVERHTVTARELLT